MKTGRCTARPPDGLKPGQARLSTGPEGPRLAAGCFLVNVRPQGNASAAALRRLRKDRPDLHAEVLAGKKSPHAAMVEAGFRPKTITVPVTVAGLMRVFDRLSVLEKAQASCRVQEWPATYPDGVGVP